MGRRHDDSDDVLCRIGITCDVQTVVDSRGAEQDRLFLTKTYVDAVAESGGTPLLLPIARACDVSRFLLSIDGLLVTGGDFDIPPAYYGQTERPGLRRMVHARSDFERALVNAAMARDLPLLGICGGMQLLNVARGGTLHQDLTERPGTGVHEQPDVTSIPFHGVSLRSDTKMACLFGRTEIMVNSTHHQIVCDLGTDVVAAGKAPDGAIEAIEVPTLTFCIGVQWHPEALADSERRPPYAGLIEAAAQSRCATR